MTRQQNPWSRKKLITIISFVDTSFGLAALGIYFYILLGWYEFLEIPVDAEIAAGGLYIGIVQSLNSGFLVFVNCMQSAFAAILFSNLIKRNPDLCRCSQNATSWLQLTKTIYVLIWVKIILIVIYSFFPPIVKNTISEETANEFANVKLNVKFAAKILVIAEWAFKPVAIYFMEKLIEDLNRYPSPLSNHITTTGSNSYRSRRNGNNKSTQDFQSNLFVIECNNYRSLRPTPGASGHSAQTIHHLADEKRQDVDFADMNRLHHSGYAQNSQHIYIIPSVDTPAVKFTASTHAAVNSISPSSSVPLTHHV